MTFKFKIGDGLYIMRHSKSRLFGACNGQVKAQYRACFGVFSALYRCLQGRLLVTFGRQLTLIAVKRCKQFRALWCSWYRLTTYRMGLINSSEAAVSMCSTRRRNLYVGVTLKLGTLYQVKSPDIRRKWISKTLINKLEVRAFTSHTSNVFEYFKPILYFFSYTFLWV